MRSIAFVVAVLLVLGSGASVAPVAASADAHARAEVPITVRLLANGLPRYSVPIAVGSTQVAAELFTGMAGLRLMPEGYAAGDLHDTHRIDSVRLGNGLLTGTFGTADVGIGALDAVIPVQLIGAECRAAAVPCGTAQMPLAQLGLSRDPAVDNGFQALLGVGIRGYDTLAQPLRALGAHRWIVELPQSPADAAGRLVINPTDDEVSGFAVLPIDRQEPNARYGLIDPVDGCVVNDATSQRMCGFVQLNVSGPTGIGVYSQTGLGTLWTPGSPARLELQGAGARVRVRLPLVVGRGPRGGGVTFARWSDGPPVFIGTGASLFYAFSVLYDIDHDTIALRPRERSDGGFVGSVFP